MKKIGIFILLLIIAALVFFRKADIGKSLPEKRSPENVSVILTGFGGKDEDGNWFGETAPFNAILDKSEDAGNKLSMCQSANRGSLYGNDILVASSGMGKVRSTACIMQILQTYEGDVKEVIFVGIGGISPSRGRTASSKGSPAMLGDVCINHLAFDFDLQHYTSDQAGTGLSNPVFWDQESRFASRYSKGDAVLAGELYEAAQIVVWPGAPESIRNLNTLYHGTSRNPKVWNKNQCIEATSDLFWNDTKLDQRAREIGAAYLSEQLGTEIGAGEVLILTSMEASSVGSVVEWWNQSTGSNIDYAYVRGASNFDHANYIKGTVPALSGRDVIETYSESGGASFAIGTASLPVIKMFELRSKS